MCDKTSDLKRDTDSKYCNDILKKIYKDTLKDYKNELTDEIVKRDYKKEYYRDYIIKTKKTDIQLSIKHTDLADRGTKNRLFQLTIYIDDKKVIDVLTQGNSFYDDIIHEFATILKHEKSNIDRKIKANIEKERVTNCESFLFGSVSRLVNE